MRVTYDPEVDVLRILLSNAPIEESDEDRPGVILDYDKDGNVARVAHTPRRSLPGCMRPCGARMPRSGTSAQCGTEDEDRESN